MSESIQDFRTKYPWHPYQKVTLFTGEEVEVISFAYSDEGTDVKINVRMIIGDPTTMVAIDVKSILPSVEVKLDYDGYFECLVKRWIAVKAGNFNHHTIVVSAMPFLPDAVQYASGNRKLELLFYSALRSGFGGINTDEISQIIELL
jgi:hypothetical protein